MVYPKDVANWYGTPEYYTPEMLKQEQYDPKQGDIWRLGCILYMLLTGGYPFVRQIDSLDLQERLKTMFSRIKRGEFNVPKEASDDCKDLIGRMLTVDSKERITLEEIQ